jgi:hypothetical protein
MLVKHKHFTILSKRLVHPCVWIFIGVLKLISNGYSVATIFIVIDCVYLTLFLRSKITYFN